MAYRKFTMDTWLLFEVGQSTQIEVACRVEFTYSPGQPETPPAYSHGGLPADPPECEITNITAAFEGGIFEALPGRMVDMAAEDSELINQCCDYAAEAMADEKAEAMERRAEDRREREHLMPYSGSIEEKD